MEIEIGVQDFDGCSYSVAKDRARANLDYKKADLHWPHQMNGLFHRAILDEGQEIRHMSKEIGTSIIWIASTLPKAPGLGPGRKRKPWNSLRSSRATPQALARPNLPCAAKMCGFPYPHRLVTSSSGYTLPPLRAWQLPACP